MIAAILYVGFISTLIVISFHKEIYTFYCIATNREMIDLFPEFYNWEEGDKILFMANWKDDRQGHLVAMSRDAIIVEGQYGDTKEIYPYQIKENMDISKKEKRNKYETFHNDILPAISETGENFPKLKSKNEINI